MLASTMIIMNWLKNAVERLLLPSSRVKQLAHKNMVGMQNSALGVVLATSHFSSSVVALPAATSVIIMNIMGSCLGFFWRCINPTQLKIQSFSAYLAGLFQGNCSTNWTVWCLYQP